MANARWCDACNTHMEHKAGSRYLYCSRCLNNNYDLNGCSTKARDAATIQPVHTPSRPKKYRVVQAMPGTDGYGWQVETLGTDGQWYNFFGERPKNQAQVERIRKRLEGRYFQQVMA